MISIIIPTFNRVHSLPRAVNSVLNQTNPNWELIIVDDGSTDNTKELIEPFLKDKRIKYFYQENKGVCAARNLGANNSNGEYLLFLDSDDLLDLNLLNNLYKNSSYGKYDLFVGNLIIQDKSTELIKNLAVDLKNFKNGKAFFLTGTYLIKKSIFSKVNGYDANLKFAENTDLLLKLLFNKNVSILKLEIIFLIYKRSEDGGSRNNENKIFAINYILNKHNELLLPFYKYRAILLRKKAFLNSFVDKRLALNEILNSIKTYPFLFKSYYHLFKITCKKNSNL